MSTSGKPKLLIATGNPGKARELARALKDIPLRFTSLTEEGMEATVEESGHTLEANALLKARAYGRASGLPTLADDSGLEVEALHGEPGVHAKGYAGEHASDEERVRFLLSKLQGVPREKRQARFRCVIAVVLPSGREGLCEGTVEGFIAFEPKGTLGFGYDPVFYLPELDKTMAELPLEVKNTLSHRGRAAKKAAALLHHMINQGELS
ncbi:MAG: RdgB/HAM1 family non-canonical purine NTP pyrophosphatase [Dehalococcoidia bacterium]|nr:RdgB/HAM1 family non-canonical purine NTP pyrophosphatase [Dehalococcoidia bacterium]